MAAGRVYIAASRFEGDRLITALHCYPALPEDSSPAPLWRTDVCETRELLPATEMATFLAEIGPRVVSTPVTRPPTWRMPVTSQFCTTSTPNRSAPRA